MKKEGSIFQIFSQISNQKFFAFLSLWWLFKYEKSNPVSYLGILSQQFLHPCVNKMSRGCLPTVIVVFIRQYCFERLGLWFLITVDIWCAPALESVRLEVKSMDCGNGTKGDLRVACGRERRLARTIHRAWGRELTEIHLGIEDLIFLITKSTSKESLIGNSAMLLDHEPVLENSWASEDACSHHPDVVVAGEMIVIMTVDKKQKYLKSANRSRPIPLLSLSSSFLSSPTASKVIVVTEKRLSLLFDCCHTV